MPKPKLKSLRNQVIVVTGATSGIGLSTARMAAERGVSLMLVARNEDALRTLAGELRGRGARAEYQVADVGDIAALEKVAERTLEAFGRLDSWVNNAGGSMYGTLEDTPIEDQRRSFDTVYWGVVNGTLVASRHLKARGGAIVNVGSVLSDRAISLQGTYCAAKHAVKGVTDAFRMEFEGAGYPIAVTLIKPSSIDTLFPEHARNRTGQPGVTLPPPTYHPRVVAKAILHACEYGPRTLVVGMGGYAISLLGNLSPRLTDYVMEAISRPAQTTSQPGRADRRDNLYEPRADLSETSSPELGMRPRRSSLLLEAQMHPLGTTGILVGLGAVLLGAWYGTRRRRSKLDRVLGRDVRRRIEKATGRTRSEASWLSRRLSGELPDRLPKRLAAAADGARDGARSLAGGAYAYAGEAAEQVSDRAGWLRERGGRLLRGLGGEAASYAGEARDRAEKAAEQAASRASKGGWSLFGGLRREARSYAGDAGERAAELARDLRGRGRHGLRDARSYADDVIERGESYLRRATGRPRRRHVLADLREGASDLLDGARDNGEWLLRAARRKASRWF